MTRTDLLAIEARIVQLRDVRRLAMCEVRGASSAATRQFWRGVYLDCERRLSHAEGMPVGNRTLSNLNGLSVDVLRVRR
jgi:hypothetical protein